MPYTVDGIKEEIARVELVLKTATGEERKQLLVSLDELRETLFEEGLGQNTEGPYHCYACE